MSDPTRPAWTEDLTRAPASFWADAHAAWQNDSLSADDYYLLHRQQAEDTANPLLQAVRAGTQTPTLDLTMTAPAEATPGAAQAPTEPVATMPPAPLPGQAPPLPSPAAVATWNPIILERAARYPDVPNLAAMAWATLMGESGAWMNAGQPAPTGKVGEVGYPQLNPKFFPKAVGQPEEGRLRTMVDHLAKLWRTTGKQDVTTTLARYMGAGPVAQVRAQLRASILDPIAAMLTPATASAAEVPGTTTIPPDLGTLQPNAPAPAPPEPLVVAGTPAPAAGSLAEHVSNALAGLGLQGFRPTHIVEDAVGRLYAADPQRESNRLYKELRDAAAITDIALNVTKAPIEGLGDLAHLLFAPLVVGMRAAGVPESDVQGFIHTARTTSQLVAAFGAPVAQALGFDPGVLGTLGDVTQMKGAGTALKNLMQTVGEQARTLTQGAAGQLEATRASETGAAIIPGPPPPPPPPAPPLEPDTPETLARQYAAAVLDARRGGPRPHAVVQTEAQGLVESGQISVETIRQIMPGSTMNDAEATAVVNVLADSGRKLQALAGKALETGNEADVTAAMQQLYLHGQIDPKRIGILTESGRTLSALNEPTSGLNRYLAQFEELLRNQTAGADPMAMLRAIVDLKDPEQLAVLARQASKPGFWDIFKESYVNGLLWRPTTWMAKGLGDSVSTLWSIPERMVAGRIPGGPGGVVPGEARAMTEGVLGSIGDAWRVAADAFREEESKFNKVYGTAEQIAHEMSRVTDLPGPAITAENLNATGAAGQAVDFLGALIRFPGRILGSVTDFFKVINYQAEAHALAFRQAFQEATAQGLQGSDLEAFLGERQPQILADLPASIAKAARENALYRTFTAELGPTGKAVQALARTPAGKIIMPFTLVPTNMAKWAGERTPMMLANPHFWQTMSSGSQAAADLAKAKVALGSFTMAISGVAAYHGMFTGGGPTDPGLRKQMYGLGWLPYAAKVGASVAYASLSRTEPIGMLMGLAAEWTEAVTNNTDESGVDLNKAAIALGTAVAKNLTSRTFVRGLAETMLAIVDPTRAAESRISSFLFSLIPMSGAVRQTTYMTDPTMREAHTIMESLKAQIPGLSKTLPPERDLFARPIFRTGVYGPIGISGLKDDPELREIVSAGARVPDIPKALQGIPLQPQERDYWAVQRGTMSDGGSTLRETLRDTIRGTEYQHATPVFKKFLLERDIHQFQNAAEAKVRDEFPVIQRSIDASQEQKANTRDSQPGVVTLPQTPLIRSLTR